MGLGSWWKKMKETYGDLPPKQAFAKGNMDGRLLTMEVKAKKMQEKAERKMRRANKKKNSILFRE